MTDTAPPSSRVPAPFQDGGARQPPRPSPAPPRPPPSPPAPQRKRRRRAVAARGQPQPWGGRLPPELLARIFQAGVESEGAVPFLCRAAGVCRDWNRVASAPQLWRKVTLGAGGCWGTAPHKRLPHTALGTVSWLVESRFSLLQEFVLCGWKSHVGFVLKALAERCPLLLSLELRHCEVDPPTLGRFLGAAGARLQRLRLSCGARMGPVLGALAAGACPHLRFLELDAALGGPGPPLPLPVERLQAACGELQVLRLRDLSFAPPPAAAPPLAPPPFGALRELSLGGAEVPERLLRRLLSAAPRLRSLDLSGCSRVTPADVLVLRGELELLSLALPGGDSGPRLPRPSRGSPALTRRWGRSLRALDLSGRGFEERDLARAVSELGPGAPLRELGLASTKVSACALRPLLHSCPALSFLDLSGCRRLPRGTKRVHRGRAEVTRCLRALAGLEPHDGAANEGAASEGAANGGADSEGAANGGADSEGAANEGAASEGAANGGTDSKGAANGGADNERAASEDAASEGAANGGADSEGVASEGAANEETPNKKALIE